MSKDNWQRAKQIFNSALELDTGAREKYLSSACAGDVSLRTQVETLLKSYESDFMENGPRPAERGSSGGRLAAGSKLGRFEILRLINVGGMGEVYLAGDQQLGRNVAIKILNEKYEGNEANLQRFIQEAKAASALNHPNILTIYEIGQTEGSYFIVSEFVEGRTLRTVLSGRTLQHSKTLEISIQIAEALSAAHRARIIHRDIKPENIIVREDGYIKVVDFGLAKLLPSQPSFIGLEDETIGQNQTTEGLIVGTVNYMSPEQARGDKIDERTDIFSLGAVIYEMIAGRAPHGADSITQTIANLLNKEPPPLSQYASVPEDLQRIVLKMLRKEPEARYQTMKGLLADLRELKERLSAESKLDRRSTDSEMEAGVLKRPTGDVARVTTESETRTGWYRRGVLLALIPALLIGILAFAWYWKQSTADQQAQIRSLAVLPLKSLDSQDDVLGLGIADAVIRRLSQTGAITVRPISAVRRYLSDDTDALTAANQLTADAVLEGSFQRANDRLRVSVNLLRTSDGASLWAESFDMRSADIFTIQDTVAQQVASRLRLHLNPDQRASLGKHLTTNALAYDYYVKGVYNFELRGLGEKAKPQAEMTADLFKKAIEADPNFALAHAQLANIYAWLAALIEPSEVAWKDRAEAELSIAERLDPEIAEIHIARSLLVSSAHYGWQTDVGIRELLEAQRLNPNVAHSHLAAFYYHVGLEDLADREYRIALEVDPTSIWTKTEMRYFYDNYRRYDELEATFRNFFPGERIWPSFYIGKGRLDEAQAINDKEIAENPDNPYALSDKAKLLALNGKIREAEALIPQVLKGVDRGNLSDHHLMYEVACNYALLGNSSEAVRFLREAAGTGYSPYMLYERDQYLDPIRNSPEFIQFLADMKPIYERRRAEFK